MSTATNEELQREEDEDLLWPGILGVAVDIPIRFMIRGITPRQERTAIHERRDRYEKAFVDKLDRVAKQFHLSLRAQIQPPGEDHFGFYRRDVMLWAEGEEGHEVDHEELRAYLHERGFCVSRASYYYGPAFG